MPEIVILDDPYKGRYPFEPTFNLREMHTIKRLSGLRGGEIWDAWQSADADLKMAFTVIALERANVAFDENSLWDKQVGSIHLDFSNDVEDADDVPPPHAAGSTTSSGGYSEPDSVNQENPQSPTGVQQSGTSAT